jgi:predicted DNA-binding transcriptional regulator AlpA
MAGCRPLFRARAAAVSWFAGSARTRNIRQVSSLGRFTSAAKLAARAVAVIRATAHLIRVPEAARITGLPRSLLRKSFMSQDKRPKNVPPPPPHKRIGRAVYILANELPAWIESLGKAPIKMGLGERRRRGRPTVAERIMRRQHEAV